ncbi:MAG: cytidylate kinase family protein [Deltaproteobacteria bacterium]|nr:cytidylate kinase family protein [Deltaproteobacteria bacterium]
MGIISITREMYSGGVEIAEEVARRLGSRCVSRELLLEAAKTYKVPEDKMLQVFETSPGFWERMTESRRIHLAYVQATLAEMAKENNLVYHGHAGQELFHDPPHVLKALLISPREERVKKVMDQYNQDEIRAGDILDRVDEERTRRVRYFFNSDWRDTSRYDLVMNLGRIKSENVVQVLIDLAAKEEFQFTEQVKGPFEDYLIKSRVNALLAGAMVGRLSLINVQVQEGVVTLRGSITSNEHLVNELVDQMKQMEGVRQVKNEVMVGLVYQEWNV